MNLQLRKSIVSDLEIFYQNQTDEEANYMAAFTPKNPNDKVGYMKKWQRLLQDETINMQTILLDNQVIGCVVKYVMDGEAEITYAIDKKYWRQGITTKAVQQFLEIETNRPIFGRVAYDNFGSQKVLEKAGFQKIGKSMWYANARGKEIEEFIYKLK